MAILRLAETHGAYRLVWLLARSAWRIWFMAAEYDDLIEAHRSGLAAARAAGDEWAVAVMTNYLASGLYRVGRVREAADMLVAAHDAFVKLGDRMAANMILSNVAVVRLALGEIDAAEAAAEEALAHARRFGESGLISNLLNSIGSVQNRRGDLQRSLELHRRELLVAVEIRGRLGALPGAEQRGDHPDAAGAPPGRAAASAGDHAQRPDRPPVQRRGVPPAPSACSAARRAGSPRRSSITGPRWTSRITCRTAG